MLKTNIGPNYAPLWDIRLWNLGGLDFDLSRSFKVKSNGAVGLLIYDFLLVSSSNYASNSHRLEVIASRKIKIFSYLLSLGPNFDPPHPHPSLPPGEFSQNRVTSSLGPREAFHEKWRWSVQYFLRYVVNRDTQTDRHTHKAILAGFNYWTWPRSKSVCNRMCLTSRTSHFPFKFVKYRIAYISRVFNTAKYKKGLLSRLFRNALAIWRYAKHLPFIYSLRTEESTLSWSRLHICANISKIIFVITWTDVKWCFLFYSIFYYIHLHSKLLDRVISRLTLL